MKLTQNQKNAVHATKGNTLVHAGSGAGKTSVFTARIANLIANEGVNPDSILGLTFTNEASENMRLKLVGIIGEKKAKNVNLTTFHSFAYRTLKSRYVGEYSNKTIMKGWWKMQQLYEIVGKPKNAGDVGLNLQCRAGDLGSFISYQKANMIKGGMKVLWKEEFELFGTKKDMQKAFNVYCDLVKNARLLDFDDMLVDLYYKLLDDENLLFDLKDQYEYIMVDEFQDTNTINMEILKLITDNNLFVVGDFRQGIYGFINANIDNILSFTKTFNDVNLIELSENFRSTKNIVEFANTIIDKSPVELYKNFYHQLPAREIDGSPVNVKVYQDEYSEAEDIIKTISKNFDSGMSYEDFAILARTNAQIGFYESLFADAEIPVDVTSSKSFFDRKEISDILSYAEHALYEHDDMSIRKIVNSPTRFISKAIVNQLNEYSYNHNISFEEACSEMNCGRMTTNVRKLVLLFEDLREDIDNMNATNFLKLVYKKTGYKMHIEKTSTTITELANREDSIKKLFEIAKKFKSTSAFLAHISAVKNNNNKNNEGVKLMTVHASKGLEFEYVFLPSVTEENFPHDMNPDIEEERRLFYVASTRAKDKMSIGVPLFNATGSETVSVSPFLLDVMGKGILDIRKSVLRGADTGELLFSI